MSKNQPQQPPPKSEAIAPENWDAHVKQTIAKLHSLYTNYVRPLEERFKYDQFHPSWYEETIINAKPFVTFFGPWSAGKSTFINHLLQSNYLWTGPQPTTAEFTAIVYGDEAGPLDGRVLANSKDHPFRGLNEFGEAFLQNFKGFQIPHELLKSVTLIDTPGVLESTQEVHQRKYDYVKLARWFAERSDLIFVMFDPTKLDSGVELKMMFARAFKGQESKIRIVLNKADMVNTQELMRVYGSLFWNLSNLVSTTEPPRVFVGSFWDQPYQPDTFHLLFSEEKADLLHELTDVIPVQALDKKVASLIRRAKDVFIHAIIIGGMRQDLPLLFGKEKAKKKAMDDLQMTYEKVAAQYKMNWRDFPPVDDYRRFLEKFDLETFPKLDEVSKEGMLNAVGNLIDTVLPRLMKPVKASAVADPTDKNRREKLQQNYHETIANQVKGVGGVQGSSDVVQTGLRDKHFAGVQREETQLTLPQSPMTPASPAPSPAAPGDQNQMMFMMMQQMMKGQQQSPASPSPTTASPPNNQMAAMMAMMQQQQQAPEPAPAPAPAPPAQPASPAGMTPEQMQQMMAMMQGGGAAPAPAPTPAPAPASPSQMSPEQMQQMMAMMQAQQGAAAAPEQKPEQID